ncbi:MAG: VWA domain-containing protein [Phycisphaeraceae bacterium]|nr:MAG: VWA domain-containing protein [Phycisphaeraceae bacterium]
MTETLRSLLNLETLDWAAEGLRFGFERPLAAWAWALIVVGAVAFSVWSYSRLTGPRFGRMALAGVRSLLILALVALLCGPRLVDERKSVERDWVVVLVDRSASLTIEDAEGPDGERISRDAQLERALAASWPMWRDLSEERTVVWLGFDEGVFDLGVRSAEDGGVGVELGAADGRRTMIGSALDQALARAAARPVAGVVLLSDGRSNDDVSRGALRRLQGERIPVHTVALGSTEPLGDFALRRIDAPRAAFIEDTTPVRAEIERIGGAGTTAGATVRLVDTATGLTLDEQRIELGSGDEDGTTVVTLNHRAIDAGEREWEVVIDPDVPDLVPGNNQRSFTIDLVDRPLRVLYVDGYPRWEQRFLRVLLLRESSVVSSGLMLAPDRRYTQEGDVELRGLPQSPEEWAEFDIIVIGDMAPQVLTVDQIAQMRDHVATRGAGLVWLAGPAHTPNSWFDTALGDLLPFSSAGAGTMIPGPFVMERLSSADRFGVLQLGDDDEEPWLRELTDTRAGWSTLWWGQSIPSGAVKPTGEALAMARATETGERTPILLTMRYGAGRVLYVATDEVWRYRYGRGEILYERFWLPLIRMLGREGLARAGRSALLTLTPDRAVIDQSVRLTVELLDQSLVDFSPTSILLRMVRTDADGDVRNDPLPREAEVALRPEGPGSRVYTATWSPPAPGAWRASVSPGDLGGVGLEGMVRVALPDDELRSPETDHAFLARLSDETGGRLWRPEEMPEVGDELPNREVTVLTEVSEPLWDTPLVLIVLLVLLTVEWVGRRVIRLI